jgi:V/A-type H+-transporting ATPase subunit D
MRLSVNPNRMELLRLRKRLVVAERGHKLLKDKLEEIMRRFLEIMRRLHDLQGDVSRKLDKVFLSFALVRCRNSLEELEELLPDGKLVLDPTEERVFNLSIPKFAIKEWTVSDYDLLNTESELDIGLKKMKALFNDLMDKGDDQIHLQPAGRDGTILPGPADAG